ncbi:MAG: GntR family transcriptional regulator [Solirubrobacteraceae bacterium]
MLISIDPTLPRALHEQIASAIRRQIVDGQLAEGERLPPAEEIARALQVNVNTVLRALRALREDELLAFRRGRGVTVARRAGDRGAVVEQARRLLELAAEHGYSLREVTTLLEAQR